MEKSLENITFAHKMLNERIATEKMGFFKRLFGGKEETPAEKENKTEKDFDVLKYDGVRALRQGQLAYAIECFNAALQLKGFGTETDETEKEESQEILEVRDYLSQALIHNGELLPAYEQLRKLSETQPENKQIFVRMAEVAYMMEDYGAMANACEKGMLVDRDDAHLLYLYSEACLGQGDMINTIAMLTRSIMLAEKKNEGAQETQSRLLRGDTLCKMGDLKGAGEDATWLLEHLEQPVEEVFLLQARILHAEKQLDDAIIYYNKVIETNPFSAVAFKERGAIYLEKGDKENAEKDMQSFLEVNPKEAEAVNGEFKAEGREHCHP